MCRIIGIAVGCGSLGMVGCDSSIGIEDVVADVVKLIMDLIGGGLLPLLLG